MFNDRSESGLVLYNLSTGEDQLVMDFLRKVVTVFLLIHLTVATVLHFLLVWLCKVSGRDNYFWAKAAFWISLPLCVSAGWGMWFPLVGWIIIPGMATGKIFYLPGVANKMRVLEGDRFPIEMIVFPQLVFHHIFNFAVMGTFVLLTPADASLFDFFTITGYLMSYVSICFLTDTQSGGKGLFKRVSERLKKAVQASKEKLGGNEALPQPI